MAEDSAARRRGPELNATKATVITIGAADFHGFPAVTVRIREPQAAGGFDMGFFFWNTLLGVGYFAAMLTMVEWGRRKGRARLAADPEKGLSGIGAIEGAILGLFGLLLAFSFGGAMTRFNERKLLVIAEANAVSTAWLRLDVLPENDQPPIRAAFREYVGHRVESHKVLDREEDDRKLEETILSKKGEIWKGVLGVYKRVGMSSSGNFLMSSLNEMFEIGEKRLAYRHNHMPVVVFTFLLTMGLGGGLMAGMALAEANRRNWLYAVGFALINAITVNLIVDIEYPRHGFVRIDEVHQVLVNTYERLR